MTEYQIYMAVAIASTLIFAIKTILMIAGGDADGDADFEAEMHDGEAAANFKLLSTQAILAFFMGAGWMALAARYEMGFGRLLTLLTASAFGVAMMLLMAYLLKQMRKLNRAGHFDISKAVGQTGTVYAKVPPKGQGEGQVKVEVDDREKIFRAVNTTDHALESFSQIVVQKIENELLYVKPKN